MWCTCMCNLLPSMSCLVHLNRHGFPASSTSPAGCGVSPEQSTAAKTGKRPASCECELALGWGWGAVCADTSAHRLHGKSSIVSPPLRFPLHLPSHYPCPRLSPSVCRFFGQRTLGDLEKHVMVTTFNLSATNNRLTAGTHWHPTLLTTLPRCNGRVRVTRIASG